MSLEAAVDRLDGAAGAGEQDASSPAPVLPEIRTVAEVAAVFGLSKSTVYGLVRAREIPHHKVGERVLFAVDELAAWWSERSVARREPDVMDRIAALPPEDRRPRLAGTGMPNKHQPLRRQVRAG